MYSPNTDRQNITPTYKFGYGLSYTSFSYSNIRAKIRDTAPCTSNKGFTKPPVASKDPAYQPVSEFAPPHALSGSSSQTPRRWFPGGNPRLYDVVYTMTATIRNTGNVAADEVPQLNINHDGPDDPKVVLRGFDRITIPAGASRTFTASLVRRVIMNWDTLSQDWVVSDSPERSTWLQARGNCT